MARFRKQKITPWFKTSASKKRTGVSTPRKRTTNTRKPTPARPNSKSVTPTGINRKSKTYQDYMKQRRRVQRLISRAHQHGQDIAGAPEELVGQIPTTYPELRRATKALEQVRSRQLLTQISQELQQKAQQQETIQDTGKPKRAKTLIDKIRKIFQGRKRNTQPKSQEQPQSTQDVENLVEEVTSEKEEQTPLQYDDKQLERFIKQQKIEEWSNPEPEQEEDFNKYVGDVLHEQDYVPPPPPPPDNELPSWEDIVIENFYNAVIMKKSGEKPLDPFRRAKWNATDLNDLMEQFSEEIMGEFGKSAFAEALARVTEQNLYDPWSSEWDYRSRAKMSFLVSLVDELKDIDPTGDTNVLFDMLQEIRDILDQGYLDDFR